MNIISYQAWNLIFFPALNSEPLTLTRKVDRVDSRLILGSCKVQIAYEAPLKIFSIAGFQNQEDNHNLFDTSVSGSNSSLANVTTFVFIKSILE